jgi:hypothetical protein
MHRRRPPQSPCHRRVLPRASAPSSSPPRSLRIVIPDHGRGPYASSSSPTRVRDAVDHACLVPKTAMPFWSLQQRHPLRAHDAVHPVPFLSLWRRWHTLSLGPRSAVILPEPTMPSNPRRPWARNVVVLPKPARLCIFFLCYFGPTNPDFDMLHCFCSAALLWCATLPHCFDILLKDRRRRPEGGEWEPIKIPNWNLAYIPTQTQTGSLPPRSRLHSYRKATSPQNQVRNHRNTTEDNNRCKQRYVRDYGGQKWITRQLKSSQAFHRILADVFEEPPHESN